MKEDFGSVREVVERWLELRDYAKIFGLDSYERIAGDMTKELLKNNQHPFDMTENQLVNLLRGFEGDYIERYLNLLMKGKI